MNQQLGSARGSAAPAVSEQGAQDTQAESAELTASAESNALSKPARSAKPRNIRVEALRLVAILGISVFHVFTPWFFGITHPLPAGLAPGLPVDSSALTALANTPWALWLLSFLALLGALGNHVFYMISALYLVPSIARQVGTQGYWRRQFRAAARRCLAVFAALALYALIFMAINHFVVEVPGAGSLWWLSSNLEFIWLYALFMLLAPIWAWLLRSVGGKTWARAAFCLIVIAVYTLNFYIAFVAQGDASQRGLLDWRKQMSALTYLVSFALAGALSWRIAQHQVLAAGKSSALSSSRLWGWALVLLLLATLAITGMLAMSGNRAGLYNLSFKSTSLLSFLLALSATFWCSIRPQFLQTASPGFTSRAVQALASGILGFYIVQALAYGLWDPFCARLLAQVLASGSLLAFIAAGVAFACSFALIVAVIDRWFRQPLLRLVGLSK
ncbi:hypothetical protein KIMH_03350 [Bombiscardovia apis]|uniref:Acyltransferase n=1 Tax=Bombiscardovia apis TaxID=2932182 RepID=A0ABN6SDU5_9BIFI|nr:hypothetical protein [Bombiscardovia apis]BDR54224.1 hypothetical protein KIMH_03350 [Bombiscardovia apis]